MDQNNDVDLEALLSEGDKPEEVVPPVASDENNDNSAAEAAAASERENDRVRRLAEENTQLKEQLATKNSTDLDKFVQSIEDEPSRNLLKTYGQLMEEKIRKDLNPLLEDYNTSKFEKEFSQFENIPNLSAHKEELRKTFLRNPSQPLKGLVGEILVEAQSSKIKPIEMAHSQASRTTPNIDEASTEDLYALLESKPPIN